jgi:hypothetical protein
MTWRSRRSMWPNAAAAAAAVTAFGGLAGCNVVRPTAQLPVPTQQQIVDVSGWTREATSTSYLVVVNVLPGERMYTPTELRTQHPVEGEAIIAGNGSPLGDNVRHVEAHVYDRATGTPVTDVVPVITLTDRTTGQSINVPPIPMQDINIGAVDRHFGDNVLVLGNSDLRITVAVNHEEVTLDGHLD